MSSDLPLSETRTEGFQREQAQAPSERLPLALMASAAFVGCGAIAMAFAPSLAGMPIALFVYAASLSLLMLGAFFLAARWRDRFAASVRGLTDAQPWVIATTDRDGNIISAGAGLRRFDPPGRLRRIDQALEMFCDDAQPVAYRLGARAAADQAAAARVRCGAASGDIQALPCGPDRILWTFSETVDDQGARDPARAFAAAAFDAEGRLASASERFDALNREDRSKIFQAARRAHEEDALIERVELPDAGEATMLVDGLDDGFAVIVAAGQTVDSDGAIELFDAMPVAVAILDPDGALLRVNGAARGLLGAEAAIGTALTDLVEGLGRPIQGRIREAAEGRGGGRPELTRRLRPNGDKGEESFLQVAMTRSELGAEPVLIAVIYDATELKVLEQQFVQSQKMQAVGQLAGGVAHDFNNLLTAIIGHCELMALRMDETAPDFEDLTQIRQNANRAAALVRQLLAFSRRQKLNPTLCALPQVLGELSNLLNRLIGEKIGLEVSTEDGLWDVYIDPQQFEQVVLNLVVNARDAMPEGGSISIRCANLRLEEELRRDRAVVPAGDYAEVLVIDDGAGISPELRAKVFEPFFTTKSVGEGTGLGLSTVYGIIKQTGGFIFIDSDEGGGTTFRILLPRPESEVAVVAKRDAETPSRDLSGDGRILLVEDEAPVRTFARRALELRGYEVLEAENAEQALDMIDTAGTEVDLVISDVIMPGMDGPTWVRQARLARPGLKVIFTSGYAEDVFRKGFDDFENSDFLAKPFSLDELSATVKRSLAERGRT